MQARILIEVDDEGQMKLQVMAPSKTTLIGFLEQAKHMVLSQPVEEPKRVVGATLVPVPTNGR